MKEIERIAIKKQYLIEKANYLKYVSSLEGELKEREESISEKTKHDVDINCFGLDIEKYYESMHGCPHEYGLCNFRDNFCGKDCLCLDCGEYLDRKDVKEVIYSNLDIKLEDIRKKYIEYLMNNSVADAYVKTFSFNYKK